MSIIEWKYHAKYTIQKFAAEFHCQSAANLLFGDRNSTIGGVLDGTCHLGISSEGLLRKLQFQEMGAASATGDGDRLGAFEKPDPLRALPRVRASIRAALGC
jgi:hypothetical protein